MLRGVGRSARRAAPDHAPGQVLREGRSAARDRHEPPVVHQDDGVPGGAAGAGPRAAVASGVHARPLRELGERPRRRLVRQPAALLRRAVPGVVSGARRRHASTTTSRSCRTSRGCRSIRRPTCRMATPTQRDQPSGFIGDPDIMDTWATSSLTPQYLGTGSTIRISSRACSRWICGRRRTTSSARGSSTRCCARSSSTARCRGARGDLGLGARSRSQEDVEVQGQRRHADGAARGARLRRRPVLVGERPAGTDTAFEPGR